MTQPGAPSAGGKDTSVSATDLIERLERWQEFGAVWRVTSRAVDTVTIALCRCDGGDEVDRLTCDEPELLAWLGGRTSSEQ